MPAWSFVASILLSSGLLHAASVYTVRLDDPAAVYLTPESFPVRGDGVADDSDALQQAIDKVGGGGILFVPKGTYRLTKTVYVWPGVRLIGYGQTRPLFKLGENTPGFQDGTGKYMFFFSGGRGRNAGGPPFDGNPGTFYSAMSNIDIEIGQGNPAAVGVRFHVAQHCYLSHMDFHLGSARAGLEDIGNEVEDLHFHGGQYGIATKRSAPGWPVLVIDCTFEGQSQAGIASDEGGLAIVRPRFTNVPTAVSTAPDKADELWISDARFENISGPALIIGNENNARMQVNLQNVACKNVPVLASFRESGKTIPAEVGSPYIINEFSHGLHLDRLGAGRQIITGVSTAPVSALPAPVASDIPALPDPATWVNVRTLGVTGDGKTDDTAALKKAIAEHRTLYLPMGWYCITDTLTLRPDTVLIGLHPSATVINLPDNTPAFQGEGSPKAVIKTPKGGTNIVTGIGVYTNAINPRAVGVKWMAGANSLMNDVRLLGGHGTRVPGQQRGGNLGNRDAWDSQPASLWVTDNGGGIFKDIWTPNPHAKSGMLISDTSTSGRVYAMSLEHHVSNEMIVQNASNWRFYAVQFEEEREEGPKALPLQIDRSSNLLFANTFFYRVISCFVPFPYATKISESRDIRFRNLHCYSNSRVSFDSTIFETTANAEVRDPELAVLDVTSGTLPSQPKTESPIVAAGAKVEKLADGFLNIAGAAVDAEGTLYFADAREKRIYRWSPEQRKAEVVRQLEQQPVNLAFDKAGNLLVVAYTGNGTVLAFRPDQENSEIVTIAAQPAAPRPGKTIMLPVNRWMHNPEFQQDSTMAKPSHFVSPDSSTFIPASQDFTTGATMWGTKMADVLRAFRLAPAIAGQMFYVTNEVELKTWAFKVAEDGTLSDPKLFANEGGECVAVDDQGNVYIAAGQIRVFDPAGKQLDTIEVPQRPICLIFGGPDRKTLFITARSSLYSVQTRFAGITMRK
jgi:sugar lactone lactonase YvrE